MTLLNLIILVENVMCIYRNYFFISNYRKKIVITRIVVELCIYVAITVTNIIVNGIVYQNTSEIIFLISFFQVLVLFKSLVTIIGGIGHSGSYRIFYEKVQNLHNHFKNESSYLNSVKRLKLIFFVGSVVFGILALLLAMIRITNRYTLQNQYLVEIAVLVVYELWIDIRYMIEHLVLYSTITWISHFVKCLNASVHEVLKKYNQKENSRISLDSNEEDFDISEKVITWTEVYQDLAACCKNISLCFNELMLLSVAATVVETVSSMYVLINIMVMATDHTYYDVRYIVYILFNHMAGTIPLLCAGQKLQNEFTSMKIALARLSKEMSSHHQKIESRQLRDLNRIVTTNPIEIKFGTLSVGIYLLPMILSLSATYIVILLQFNHVI